MVPVGPVSTVPPDYLEDAQTVVPRQRAQRVDTGVSRSPGSPPIGNGSCKSRHRVLPVSTETGDHPVEETPSLELQRGRE